MGGPFWAIIVFPISSIAIVKPYKKRTYIFLSLEKINNNRSNIKLAISTLPRRLNKEKNPIPLFPKKSCNFTVVSKSRDTKRFFVTKKLRRTNTENVKSPK